ARRRADRGGDGGFRPPPAAAGRGRPGDLPGRARHVAGHGRVRVDPRARLRPHHRGRAARAGARRPGRHRGLPGHPGGRGMRDNGHEPVAGGHIETEVPPLELVGVHAAYTGIEVLHGIDLAVAAGEVVALLGANGAGKSTTVKVCAGLLRPTAGAVRVAGHDVTGVPSHELARIGVCTVPEGRGVFPNLTVRENLWMATQVRGAGNLARLEDAAYARFPRLGERRTQLAGTMSGGEQQMLAMARALVTDPAVLLFDELSMGLAPIVVQQLYSLEERRSGEE